MPYKPKRPCAYPGCPELTDAQYCDEHKRKTDQDYNKYTRDKFSKTFYNTTSWKLIRKKHLESYPLCLICLTNGIRERATIVDHIIPIKQGGNKYESSNLQSLCWSCHSRKSVVEGSRF